MKVILILFALVAAVFCEPPSYRLEEPNVQIQRVEVYEVPYVGSEWKPAAPLQLPRSASLKFPPITGPAAFFQLPVKPATNFKARPAALTQFPGPTNSFKFAKLEATPAPPGQIYGPPQQEYGPPTEQTATTEINEATTTELPTTTQSISSGKLRKPKSRFVERGSYYIYHPNGQLQKVVYATKDDIARMEYSAKLRYEDVEPIRDPIYTYNPETLVLERLKV